MATIPRILKRPEQPMAPVVLPPREYSHQQMTDFGWLAPPLTYVTGVAVPRTPDPRIPAGEDPRIPRKDENT